MDLRRTDGGVDEAKIAELTRSSRFVEQDNAWFFVTREGLRVGPYSQLFDAELGASLLVARLAQLDADRDPRQEIIQFQNDPLLGPASTATRPRPEKRMRSGLAVRHSASYVEKIGAVLTQIVPVVYQSRKRKT